MSDPKELKRACAAGETALVAELLPGLSPVDVWPLLCTAMQHGQLEVMQMLLAAGAPPQPQLNELLSSAVYKRRPDMVRVLVDAGADVRGKMKSPTAPLPSAAKLGGLETVQVLLAAGAVPDACALQSAATKDHVEVLRELVRAGADVEQKDIYDTETALHKAAAHGKVASARVLLEEGGANPNAKRTSDACTPLRMACENGHLELVELLLEALPGDQVDAVNIRGCTALWAAAVHEHAAIVKRLLDAGASEALALGGRGMTASGRRALAEPRIRRRVHALVVLRRAAVYLPPHLARAVALLM